MNVRLPLSALLAIGVLVLTACSDDAAPSARSEPLSDPAPDYVLLLDDDADPDQMEGEPGAYAMTARGHETPPLAVVDVPAGFSNFGFFAMWPSDTGSEAEDDDPFQAVQYWTVYGVYSDPCLRTQAAPKIGDSVTELAEALAMQQRTKASAPMPVSLGGHEGLYLELTVPRGLRFESCDLDAYVFWEGMWADAHHVASPGAVERVWIIDVNGTRVVLAAVTGPGVPGAKSEVLTEVVESVRFEEPA